MSIVSGRLATSEVEAQGVAREEPSLLGISAAREQGGSRFQLQPCGASAHRASLARGVEHNKEEHSVFPPSHVCARPGNHLIGRDLSIAAIKLGGL